MPIFEDDRDRKRLLKSTAWLYGLRWMRCSVPRKEVKNYNLEKASISKYYQTNVWLINL